MCVRIRWRHTSSASTTCPTSRSASEMTGSGRVDRRPRARRARGRRRRGRAWRRARARRCRGRAPGRGWARPARASPGCRARRRWRAARRSPAGSGPRGPRGRGPSRCRSGRARVADRPPPGRAARSEATIVRRPESGSMRTSGIRHPAESLLEAAASAYGALVQEVRLPARRRSRARRAASGRSRGVVLRGVGVAGIARPGRCAGTARPSSDRPGVDARGTRRAAGVSAARCKTGTRRGTARPSTPRSSRTTG